VIADVNSDQQQKGLETDVNYDRSTASRLGLTVGQIDSTLYDAFGQRQVSTIYNALNQYHVVMEVAPRYWQSPETLKDIYVSTAAGAASGTQSTNSTASARTAGSPASATNPATAIGASNSVENALTNAIANTGRGAVSNGAAVSASVETMVPLRGGEQLSVRHHAPGGEPPWIVRLDHHFIQPSARHVAERCNRRRQPGHPGNPHAHLDSRRLCRHGGTFQQSLSTVPLLIAAALLAVYIVLGVLYESYIHPITIISTLPSAGVGAVLALMVWHIEFSIMAAIGVILLIGIVKKNAIMMIDFAIHAERTAGIAPREAIYQACLLRFRPIMMTTLSGLARRHSAGLQFRQWR
jgi:multidrug efflux pump